MENTPATPAREDTQPSPSGVIEGFPASGDGSLAPPKVNRLPDYLAQIEDYWFRGPKRRFAKDAGISESTFSRIFHGVTNPRYRDVCRIVALLEQKLGKKIDPRDIYEL